MKTKLSLFILLVIFACKQNTPSIISSSETPEKPTQKPFVYDSLYVADGFDFPVGKPNAKKYYNAQGFTKNNHLGDDWNGIGGGNTDLGDAIYSIANGKVVFAQDIGGAWGKVVRVVHQLKKQKFVESLYAHCDSILVKKDQYVKRGEKIATIGTADGAYLAHLHFEIRDSINMPIGAGYSVETKGYVDPTVFINANRP